MTVIDLFAGPGGWDLAARELGIDPLGIEWDAAACATRRAAGLRTLQADVAELDPEDVLLAEFDGPDQPVGLSLDGLIASPPCQAFSMAGKGEGRRAMTAYKRAIADMDAGRKVDVDALDEASGDPRGHLVLEPLRWALALNPEWVALEQVRPVLPLWEAMSHVLQRCGYKTWTGILSAERYGVPQTRQRAILLASRTRDVRTPRATHQRWVAPPKPADDGMAGLFDPPPAERIVHREDRALLPWVSMAEALGWDEGGVVQTGINSMATSRKVEDGHDAAERVWTRERPATTVAGDARIFPPGHKVNADDLAAGRGGQKRSGAGHTHYDRRQSGKGGDVKPVSIDRPAPTIAAMGLSQGRDVWTDQAEPTLGQPDAQAVRVTVAEAAVLQSFPANYPWQGSKTKQHEQVGNAIPPGLARACLLEVLG